MTILQDVRGFVSTRNSTTVTLGGSGVFTGVGDDARHFASVTVTWNSDVPSADDGVLLQFSTDNSNWDHSIVVHSHGDTLQANDGGYHRTPILARYFRVVFTNGSGAQSNFRLQTILHTAASGPLTSRLVEQFNTSSDCAANRPISSHDLEMARRQVTGQRSYFFSGENDDIGTSFEDLVPEGGDVPWQTSAVTVAVSSSDAADTASGAGVRSVEIHGLSDTGVDQSEVIDTNGTTEVSSALTYRRINRFHAEAVGTYGGANRGDMTLRVESGGAKSGDILAQMKGLEGNVDTSVQYGTGEAQLGLYSVPLGKVLYITGGQFAVNTTASKTATIAIYEREDLLDTTAPMAPRRLIRAFPEIQGIVPFREDSHIKIKALADIWIRALGSNTGTKVGARFDFYLLDANAAGE